MIRPFNKMMEAHGKGAMGIAVPDRVVTTPQEQYTIFRTPFKLLFRRKIL